MESDPIACLVFIDPLRCGADRRVIAPGGRCGPCGLGNLVMVIDVPAICVPGCAARGPFPGLTVLNLRKEHD